MQYAMFLVMRSIRRLNVPELASQLIRELSSETETFDTREDLSLNQQNRWQLHRLLARITDFLAVGSGGSSLYTELVGNRQLRYEVEHVWAYRFEEHTDESSHEIDFIRHRNKIGDLLLLPKSFNASYGDDSYEAKLPHYFGQNILARSLNPQCYERNPGFVRFIRDTGLPFRAHPQFRSADIHERSELYRQIAKQMWDPEHLLHVASRIDA